jgi:hypothetical protein
VGLPSPTFDAYLDEWVKVARKQRPPYPPDRRPIEKGHAKELLKGLGLIGIGTAGGLVAGGALRYGIRRTLLKRYLRKNPAGRRKYERRVSAVPGVAAALGGLLGLSTAISSRATAAERRRRMEGAGLPRERR